MNSVLLAVDLTKAVADEAIEGKHCVVVAYRTQTLDPFATAVQMLIGDYADPIIFKGLKSLTLDDPQQQSLLRLALEGISVYSPHTAVDAAPGGMADWLCDIVTGTLSEPEPETRTAVKQPATEPDAEQPTPASKAEDPFLDAPNANLQRPSAPKRSYSRPTYPGPTAVSNTDLTPSNASHTRSVIQPSPDLPASFPSDKTGMGRLITFNEAQALTHLIERIARGVGSPKGFPVAIPQNKQVEDITIRTVGICPGSGESVLRDCGADLLFTGELSHHEALAATERGAAVVTLFHSNSERGFLHSVMREKLTGAIEKEWAKVREQELESFKEDWEDALKDENVAVEVSKRDRDPYGIVILQGSEQVGTKI